MRNIFTIFCALGVSAVSVSALNINVTPGSLASKSAELSNTLDNTLILSGKADVRDLQVLSNLSEKVKTVDMSGLQIASYTYTEGNYMGKTSFAEAEIPAYIFAGARFNTINLPGSLKKIGESSFIGSQIQSIDFPVSLKEIGNYAFSNSDNLVDATLNSEVKLGVGVFKDCDALKNVNFKADVSSIPNSMFDGCIMFTGNIPSSVTSIGDFAYRGTALEEIDLTRVKKIGDYSFADMRNLNAVAMDGVAEIELGKGVFFNDGALEHLPFFNTDLSQTVFSQTSGDLERGLDSEFIGEAAFANNKDIDTIFLGSKVKYIGPHAFRNLTSLTLVNVEELGSNVIDVDPDAFSGLLNEEGVYPIDLNVKEGTEEEWEANEVWKLFNIGQFTVGVDNIVNEATADIKIKRVGNGVSVQSSHIIDYIGIFSINGMTLHESKPGVSSLEMNNVFDSEIIVVKVISDGISKLVKLK